MKTDIDTIPNLYSITGNILDINTVLINREELRKLIEAKKDLLDALQSLIDEYEPNMKTFATDAPRKAKWMAALAAVHLHKD